MHKAQKEIIDQLPELNWIVEQRYNGTFYVYYYFIRDSFRKIVALQINADGTIDHYNDWNVKFITKINILQAKIIIKTYTKLKNFK